jgi:ubiquitin carboxyl-terminal hydrolase L5
LTQYDEDFYFAKQVIINACATQAILGVLLNSEDKIDLGPDLLEFKSFTKLMDPYMRGLSISNCEKIRVEHNKFGKPEPFIFTGKRKATDEDDVFHFVSYIHFKNNVYEIDGLREGPILVLENVQFNEWVNSLKPAIMQRINLYSNNEIKFNLLSVVPDRRLKAQENEAELLLRKEYILSVLSGNKIDVNMDSIDFSEYDNMSKDDLHKILNDLEFELENQRMIIADESNKFEKYRVI